MRTRMAAASLGLSLLVAAAALAQGWVTYSPPQGTFSVLLPGKPRFEKSTVASEAGPLALHNYTVGANGGATAYIVSFTDYPAAVIAKADPQKMLAGARDGQLKNLQATATSDKVIALDGSPGRDVQFKNAKGFTGRCKMFLVKNRLYQVLALTTNGTGTSADFAKFVDSFKLK